MIVEEIKNSITSALLKADENLVLYFDKPLKTEFPYAILLLNDFKIEASAIYSKQKCLFDFSFIFQISKDNTPIELLDLQEKISNALLPAINISGKKITLDEVQFLISSKQLLMNFKLNFYKFEINEENTTMQTLDITYKGE